MTNSMAVDASPDVAAESDARRGSGPRVGFGLLGAPQNDTSDLVRRAWEIGRDVAAPVADEVDRDARFPIEAVEAMKRDGLLAALVPSDRGGLGASLAEVAGAIRAMAVHCTSSALVLAMHSIEVPVLVRYGTTPYLRGLVDDIVAGRLLVANAYSEVGLGGDVSQSICAVEDAGEGRHRLVKKALAISYGAHADAIITIARRHPDAEPDDRYVVACRTDQIDLEPTSTWNPIGLRGTCSSGFTLTAEFDDGAIFPGTEVLAPHDATAHLNYAFLSAVWVGVAEAAAAKAHAFVRAAARKSIGTVPPTANALAPIAEEVNAARALLRSGIERLEAADQDGTAQDADVAMAIRTLKLSASHTAVKVSNAALELCGMAGFQKGSPFSLDRILRDSLGGPLMVSNGRLRATNARALIARKAL